MNNRFATTVENRINHLIDQSPLIHKKLRQAMKYSINAGGKRLRPCLLMEVYEALNGDYQDVALNYAGAIEMIHTYSLIHDDLPALDNDDLRRGKKTNHIVYGEALAILAGDALLNSAMEILINQVSNENTKRASIEIAKASGVSGMISGQVYDMELAHNKEQLEHLHMLKTAKLLKCSINAASYLAGADKTTIDLLDEYGSLIGVSFQISDDLLDVESSEEILGKPINSDEKNHKTTYVTLYGLKEAKEILKKKTDKAVLIARELNINYLEKLAVYIMERKN